MDVQVELDGHPPLVVELRESDSLRDVKRNIKTQLGLGCSAGDLVLMAQAPEELRVEYCALPSGWAVLQETECLHQLSSGSIVRVKIGTSRLLNYSDVVRGARHTINGSCFNKFSLVSSSRNPGGRLILKETAVDLQNPPEGACFFNRMKKVTRADEALHENFVTEHGLWYRTGPEGSERDTGTYPLRGGTHSTFKVCVVMDLVDGRSLDEVMYSGGFCDGRPLCEAGLWEAARQILRALHRMHRCRVVYGHLHLSHVMLERGTGLLKLLPGYGLSHLCTNYQHCYVPCNTILYLAPEVMKGDVEKGSSLMQDIWALGVCLVELALGRFPFKGNAPLEVYCRVAKGTGCPVDWDGVSLSKDLCNFLSKCLQRDPAQRSTAEELLQHPRIVEADRESGRDALLEWMNGMVVVDPTETAPVDDALASLGG
eukprot:TRINITY_DN1824_c0_g1_i11.p1 TRINITY_DN1824_c0_g1~~TRINITY_DN1824_c0_g1_i11.p1  ORF type:complete len:428 (+),score=132.17 TRINITY_DN1824_c0_g1_i11:995-2278(+)